MKKRNRALVSILGNEALTSKLRNVENKEESNTSKLSFLEKELSLKEIISTLSSGHTVCPATFINNDISDKNWKQQKLFCLSFDSSFNLEAFQKRLTELGLLCNLVTQGEVEVVGQVQTVYHAFFLTSEPIRAGSIRDYIIHSLCYLFPGASLSTKNRAYILPSLSLFRKVYYKPKYRLNLPNLICASIIHSLPLEKSDRTVERYIKKECRKTTEVFNNTKEPWGNWTTKREYKWEDAQNECHILADFLSGERTLNFYELLGLASNLRFIEGGEKQFKTIVCQHANYGKDKEFEFLMSLAKQANIPPISLESFSPYKQDHIYENLLTIPLAQGEARPHFNAKSRKMSLKSAERKFLSFLYKALNRNDCDIHIFKVPTGLGKTRALHKLKNVLLAFPNHDLKLEVSKNMEVSHLFTPASINGLSERLQVEIDYLYRMGLGELVPNLLRKLWLSPFTTKADKNLLLGYFIDTQDAYHAKCTVLTTHHKALLAASSFKHKTMIFDEDPFNVLFTEKSIKLHELDNLAFRLEEKGLQQEAKVIYSVIKQLRGQKVNSPTCLENFTFENKEAVIEVILENPDVFESDLISFLDASFVITSKQINRDITEHHYLKKMELPHNKKVIILSATVNEEMYRALYGERVHFTDLSDVEYVGEIVQYTRQSFSKSRLAQPENLKLAKDLVGNDKVITFMSYRNEFPNSVKNMYFGKTTGFNELSGEDITVLGTPNLPQHSYALIAMGLGYKLSDEMYNDFRYRRVRHNGYSFWFSSFGHPVLQRIQFHFVEEGLIQALGRGRSLRMKNFCRV
ncbi:MAG: hypothetical protein KDE33_22110, partial [Bacteroidetes bacterium]|nr:hypothetical protein [Bacteroidota bacterium]